MRHKASSSGPATSEKNTMSEVQKTLYLVFSNWRPGKEAEFHKWYAEHVSQILAVDGFQSARRMVSIDIEGRSSPRYTHVVAYEISGDANQAFQNLRAARAAGHLSDPDFEIMDRSFEGMVYGLVD
jgi:hypothetical protein